MMIIPQGMDGGAGGARFSGDPTASEHGVWIEFNLGSAKDLGDMVIWNYGESAPGTSWTQQGARDVQIFYTTLGGGAAIGNATDTSDGWGSDSFADWTQVGGEGNVIELKRADEASVINEGFLVATDRIAINDTAQYVMVLGSADGDRDNWNLGNPDVGLSEVRFELSTGAPPPDIVASAIGDQTGFSFTSATSTVYELQRGPKSMSEGLAVGMPSLNEWDTQSEVSVIQHAGHPGAEDRNVENIINGSGISGTDGELHGTDVSGSMWMSRPENAGGSGGTAQNPGQIQATHYVTLGFDEARTLGSVWIWNWNEQAWPKYGWKNLAIQVSTTNGTDPSDWTTVHTDIELPQTPANGDLSPSIQLDMGGVEAQYVAIINTGEGTDATWQGDANNAGLSEIRIYGQGERTVTFEKSDTPWQNTGARAIGDGSVISLYDPSGYDTNNFYQVVPAE